MGSAAEVHEGALIMMGSAAEVHEGALVVIGAAAEVYEGALIVIGGAVEAYVGALVSWGMLWKYMRVRSAVQRKECSAAAAAGKVMWLPAPLEAAELLPAKMVWWQKHVKQ
eukprot:scaffold45242_cov20-Tisochrysis_lutea.AAC.1